MNQQTLPAVSSRLKRSVVFGVGRQYAPRGGRANILLNELRELVVGRILDVGAGANGAIFAQAFGSRYEALDIGASYKITEATERDALRHVADIEGKPLPFGDQAYDTVLCMDTLEHIDDPHLLRDELFRIARQRVIVSLPNNWPNFMWSLIRGRNITHSAGYGIAADPKPGGQRHKHFFNLEEACAFLLGRVPPEFDVERVEFRFEHGHDGLLASIPSVTKFFRIAGKVQRTDAVERFGPAGTLAWAAAKTIYLPFRAVDVAASAALYGWGSPLRFYNLFCRQIWVVYKRRAA